MFRLCNVIIHNRAPFKDINIDFGDENINILTGINGKGKTTILSYIVDSMYELAKSVYLQEFKNKEEAFYRVSSNIYSIDRTKASIVYLRYKLDNKYYDYIDIRNSVDESKYNEIITLDNKIEYKIIESELKEQNVVKKWNCKSEEDIKVIFEKGIITYFPTYRFEVPTYLNIPYKPEPKFNISDKYSDYLINRIEVNSSIQDIANWIMDVVLDNYLYSNTSLQLLLLNDIISKMLSGKFTQRVRFGIGNRNNSMQRISIMENATNGKMLYPSIFNMSEGELSLLCIFGEIIRQIDALQLNDNLTNASGIVLIDEIDKNLHIKLQTEVLPSLLNTFPNIQFIITSHSPFLQLGLTKSNMRYCSMELDENNVRKTFELSNVDSYNEVYELFIKENENYKKEYEKIKDEILRINSNDKTVVLTEGKTDRIHLINALGDRLKDFVFPELDVMGDKTLLHYLIDFCSNCNFSQKIIGTFDRDNFDELNTINKKYVEELKNNEYIRFKDSNVYAFAIPLVNEDIYNTKNISIEHYYRKNDLLRKDENGRRLYLGEEFDNNQISKDEKMITRCKELQKKINDNGVIDGKVYSIEDKSSSKDIALSKVGFAELVKNNKDVDTSNFEKIFDVLNKIKNLN